MTNAWAHLPNAIHIDRIISSVKEYPLNWGAARTRDAAKDAAYYAAWNSAYSAVRNAAYVAVRDAAYVAVRNAAYAAVRNAAYATNATMYAAANTACWAMFALIVYPTCVRFLDMTPDELRIWAELSEDPGAILLLPAVIAFSKEKEIA